MNRIFYAVFASACFSLSANAYYSRYWVGTTEVDGKYCWTSVESHNWTQWYSGATRFDRNYFVNRNFATTGSREVFFAESVNISQATILGNERKDEEKYLSSALYAKGGPIVFSADADDHGLISTGDYYIGGDEGDGSLEIISGKYQAQCWNIGTDAGKTGTMAVRGGTVIGTGDPCVGDSGCGSLTVGNGGVFQSGSGENVRRWIQLARYAGATGTININEGGVLCGSKINQGSGTGEVNFNGGTFRAIYSENEGIFPDHANLTVQLNEQGGTIDTQGYASWVKKAITGTGSLTKKGAGTLTFTAMPTFTGKITVLAGAGNVLLPTGATIAAGDNTKKYDNGTNTIYSNIGDNYETTTVGSETVYVLKTWLADAYGDDYTSGSVPEGFSTRQSGVAMSGLEAYALGFTGEQFKNGETDLTLAAEPGSDGTIALSFDDAPAPRNDVGDITYRLLSSSDNYTWTEGTALGVPVATISLGVLSSDASYFKLRAEVAVAAEN